MVELLGGNFCSLLAMVTDSISATRKTAKEILWVQNLSQIFYGVGALLLKGYSAAVQNAVSILRNMIAIWNVKSKVLEWGMILLGVVLGFWFNNRGVLGWLPVIANLQYSIAVFRFRDRERAMKMSFLICLVLFVVFNIVILNVVGAVTNSIVLVTTAIELIRKKGTGASNV